MSILAIGVDADPTMVHFLGVCKRKGIPVTAVNLREVAASGSWRLAIPDGPLDVDIAGQRVNLANFAAAYIRMINLTWHQEDVALRQRWFGMMSAFVAALACSPSLIVNRPLAGAHNSTKPLHEATLSALGFRVPPSITSSDQAILSEFVRERPSVIKSLSGARGDTALVTVEDLKQLERAQGPIHIQELVPGADIRIHVVGEKVISTRVDSHAVDYRVKGAAPRFSKWVVPDELCKRVVLATRRMGLSFAGWDFKLDALGEYWCLEANPQPGYAMYDRYVDGAISDALIELLQSGHHS